MGVATPHYRLKTEVTVVAMRVLAVTYENRVPDNDCLYCELAEYVELDKIKLDRTQALHLQATLASTELLDYDRVILEVRAKHAMSQWRELWKIPNLVLYEEDTWQNFAAFSKNFGMFARFYESVQPVRILHSGFEVAQNTRALGFDSCFLPKGYDGSKLRNFGGQRDIELGFVGRVEHSNYVHRREILTKLAQFEPLQLLRTSSETEYLQTLNRIRFFISADIGFGEHMIKNFEALACGCVLFVYPQGLDDAELGFQDMVNVVFYESIQELRDKLKQLRNDDKLVHEIATNGQTLAESNHDHRVLGKRFFELLDTPLRMAKSQTWDRGKRLAAKRMSLPFFSKHWNCEQLKHESEVLEISKRSMQFRFFDASRYKSLFGLDGHKKFIEQTYMHASAGVAVPNILYWGIQKELNVHWVAYDALQPVQSASELSDKNLTELLFYMVCLHRAGICVHQLVSKDVALNAQSKLIWIEPRTRKASNSSLSSKERLENLHSLLANPSCLLHCLGALNDIVEKYTSVMLQSNQGAIAMTALTGTINQKSS